VSCVQRAVLQVSFLAVDGSANHWRRLEGQQLLLLQCTLWRGCVERWRMCVQRALPHLTFLAVDSSARRPYTGKPTRPAGLMGLMLGSRE
jgi:hypothetical protein